MTFTVCFDSVTVAMLSVIILDTFIWEVLDFVQDIDLFWLMLLVLFLSLSRLISECDQKLGCDCFL
jgi:hypothetical protein